MMISRMDGFTMSFSFKYGIGLGYMFLSFIINMISLEIAISNFKSYNYQD